MTADDAEINRLRTRIDHLNQSIRDLLEQRMRVAAEIAARKRELGLVVHDEEREESELRVLRESCDGALAPEAAARIFRAVFAEARRAQESAPRHRDRRE